MSGSAPPKPDYPFDAGPYIRLQQSLGLMRPDLQRVTQRAVLLAAVAWLPLLILSALQGLALGPNPRESLLLDVSAYARYLIALPMLVVAERICLPRLAGIAGHFVDAGLVTDEDRPRFDGLIASTRQLLQQRWAEIGLVLLAYTVTVMSTGVVYPADVSSWAAPTRDGVSEISLAGWWRMLVSQPLFLILVVAWLWRVAVWTRFLWKVSRLDLQLVASHPDLAGGLYFVTDSVRAFMPVAFAIGAAVAGGAGEAIVVDGRPPQDFRFVVVAAVVLVLALFQGPLMVFTGPLRRARFRGIFAYGELADAVGRQFERRWLDRSEVVGDEALSAQDFSATTDLFAIVSNVRQVGLVLYDLKSLLLLAVAVLLPFVPLVLAVLPLDQLLKMAMKLVL